MKRLIVTSLASLLLVLATALPAAASHAAVPFHGSWTGPDGFDFAAPGCPAGAFLRFSSSGRSEFTHLGLTKVETTHCTYLDAASPSGSYDHGVTILTAANGDTLILGDRGAFTLTPNPSGPPPFSAAAVSFEWWVAGGTGRFADASGSGTGWSSDDMLAGVQVFHLSGSIRY